MSEVVKDSATEPVGDAAKEEKWETLIEGKAKILHKPGEAFYNPAQVMLFIFDIVFLKVSVRDRWFASRCKTGICQLPF